ncbi:hypothetical protein GCM10009422_25880 [Brevundimonas kwangchunensis]|uniref:histidine kinase n=1 Tax=Brevundimonas kwangchunensis TaxID=322163 RepID=A0ABP3S6T5_9CAUL
MLDFAHVDSPILSGGGRAGERIRSFPWRETPIGPIESWDRELISALNLIMTTRFPMFLTWGPEHQLFHNDAYEPAITGKGDCIGRPLRMVFPEAWLSVAPLLARTLAGEATYFEDYQIPLARNAVLSPTWWSFSYSPVRKADGEIGGVLGVVYETTRRFLAEQALRSSESALIAVTDMAPSLLWRCDSNGRMTWANQRLLEYIGREGVSDLDWDDNLHPDNVPDICRQLNQCQLSGHAFESQQRIKGGDGEYRWFIVRSQQVLNSDGASVGWCGSAIDIDDWKTALHDRLGDRTDLMRQFSASDATLMWVADVRSREVEALNPEARAAWALPVDGKPVPWSEWISVMHPDDQPQMAMLFDRVADGEVTQIKFRRVTEDGGLRRFHATAFPIPGNDGAVRRIGGMVVDVTRNVDQRIYLIDTDTRRQNALSHALTRLGMRVRAFDDTASFERVSTDLLPGCVILAERSDFDQTLHTAGVLTLNRDRLPWIVVGAFDRRLDDVVRLMKLGAADVVIESRGPDAISAAVVSALSIHRPAAGPARQENDARRRIAELSRREREVLEGLVAGCTNKTIALQLQLSPRTVETHRAHLMDRLGVNTLADLLKLASDAGVEGGVKKA